MQDILGRKINDGDLCIGMAIGRNSNGMHLGIFKGSSVVYITNHSCNEYLQKSCTSNTYLIANPTEQELEIKNKILQLLEEEENERKRKANLKTIPLSKLEVGGIYKTTQNQTYMYLGKRKVTFENINRKCQYEQKEGYCFVHIYSYETKTDEEIINGILSINPYRIKHNVDILKGNKKLTELVRKIDLEYLKFPLVKNNLDYTWYSGTHDTFKLTIE